MLGRGRHQITQPSYTLSSSMIILQQLIAKQNMVDDILNVLVLSFIGSIQMFFIIYSLVAKEQTTRKEGIFPQFHALPNSR